jgi:hypothetical protein
MMDQDYHLGLKLRDAGSHQYNCLMSLSPLNAAKVMLTVAACLATSLDSLAQQTQPASTPDAPTPAPQTQTAPNMANPIQGSVAIFFVLQKKSLVFPDLATNSGPLDPWGKFQVAANSSVAVSTIGGALIGAGFSQAINSPSGYHQGAEGYAKRFGADMARAASGNILGSFLLASALHQDPRFYPQRNLSFGKSVEYAAYRVLYTRSDSGEKQINYSGLIGPLMGEGLANAYYPDENRTVGSTFTRYASDLGWRFAGNLLRQYWPEINRKLELAPDSASTK